MTEPARDRLGLVLSSGGARGAYQAGALSVLLPALESKGHRPSIFAGISAGGINALLCASHAHLPAAAQAEALVDGWRTLHGHAVFAPLLRQAPTSALAYLGEVFGVPGVKLRGLFGTDRFQRSIASIVPFDRLADNVDRGVVRAVTLVATTVLRGKKIGFLQTAEQVPDAPSSVTWARTSLAPVHAVASCAVPILMPSIYVDRPRAHRGWYLDGSVGLRTPLRPALDLGADRLCVVGCTPLTRSSSKEPEGEPPEGGPDLADSLVCLLDALLDDALEADLDWLQARSPSVPHLVVAPGDQGRIGAHAIDIVHRGARLERLEFRTLHRLLGGSSPLQGELLSFLLFDREFIDALIALGQSDAKKRLASPEPLWSDASPTG